MRTGNPPQRLVYQDFKKALILALLLIAMPPLALLCNMVDLHISPMPLAVMLAAILVGERAGLSISVLLSLLAAMLASQPGGTFGFDAAAMLLFTLTSGIGATYALRRVQTGGLSSPQLRLAAPWVRSAWRRYIWLRARPLPLSWRGRPGPW